MGNSPEFTSKKIFIKPKLSDLEEAVGISSDFVGVLMKKDGKNLKCYMKLISDSNCHY